MSVLGLEHVAIVVADMEAALQSFKDHLGLVAEGVMDYGQGDLKIAFIAVGTTQIELIQPLRPGTSSWERLERLGPGVDHVALRVDDIDAEVARLSGAPGVLRDPLPRPGAGDARIAFLNADALGGALVELCGHGPGTLEVRRG